MKNRTSLRSATLCATLALLLPLAAGAGTLKQTMTAPPGGVLRIELDYGAVSVVSHDADEVRVDARAHGMGASGFAFELRQDAEGLKLAGRAGSWLQFMSMVPSVEVRAWVPRWLVVEVETRDGSVEVASVGGALVRAREGSIRVRDVAGAVDVETTRGFTGPQAEAAGAIDVFGVGGDVRASSSGARIHVSGVAGNVEARAGGGEIEIDGVSGEVVAITSDAAILARFTRAPAGVFETDGGRIQIAFPADVGARLDATARGGCIFVDRDASSACGTRVGTGGSAHTSGLADLELRAGDGGIRLQTL